MLFSRVPRARARCDATAFGNHTPLLRRWHFPTWACHLTRHHLPPVALYSHLSTRHAALRLRAMQCVSVFMRKAAVTASMESVCMSKAVLWLVAHGESTHDLTNRGLARLPTTRSTTPTPPIRLPSLSHLSALNTDPLPALCGPGLARGREGQTGPALFILHVLLLRSRRWHPPRLRGRSGKDAAVPVAQPQEAASSCLLSASLHVCAWS